ncbi:MAG: hypothetical protein ACNA8L_03020 [Luteolibacter sp.]|jgi:hypothetical protein
MKKTHLLPILAIPAILGLVACGDADKGDNAASDNAAASSSTGVAGGVPYVTELPPELIEGTPVPISLPNLEPAPTSAPEFNVPEGTVLLSAGKTVTSSDDFPLIGTLDLITDGEKDAGEGYYVELEEGKQWIQIDLEQEAAIHAVHVWHYHSQRRAYKGVVAQISNDPEFKDGVTTIFNSDFENAHGFGAGRDRPYVETRFGKVMDGRGTVGRFVRLYSAGNTSDDTNHYIEVEVHGIPAE